MTPDINIDALAEQYYADRDPQFDDPADEDAPDESEEDELQMEMKSWKYTKTSWNGDPAADRDKFIGGSDAGTILGLNPYKSAYTLFLEKTGQLKPEDLSGKLSVWFGSEEEEIVAKRFCLETGKKVRRSLISYGIEEYPFLRGHVDRLIVGENEGLECKTTGSWNRTNFCNGDVPPAHYAQCQFYMLVTGKQGWWYAVKRDNYEFFYMRIERDNEYISEMLDQLIEFWHRVEEKRWPSSEIDGSDSTSESISKMYPHGDDEETVMLSSDDDDLMKTRAQLKQQIDELKLQAYTIDNQIKDALKDAERAESEHFKVSWVNTHPKPKFNAEALKNANPSEYEKYLEEGTPGRVFRITEKKLKKKENN